MECACRQKKKEEKKKEGDWYEGTGSKKTKTQFFVIFTHHGDGDSDPVADGGGGEND
jgi:hypothetical protein